MVEFMLQILAQDATMNLYGTFSFVVLSENPPPSKRFYVWPDRTGWGAGQTGWGGGMGLDWTRWGGMGPDWTGGGGGGAGPDRMGGWGWTGPDGGGAGPERHPPDQRIKDQGSRIMDLVLARMSILEEIRT